MRTEYKHNPPIPYSLHDMRVKKIIIQDQTIALEFEDGYEKLTEPFEQVEGNITIEGVDFDCTCVMLQSKWGNYGKFNGEKLELEHFIKRYKNYSFEIVNELYGYNQVLYSSFLCIPILSKNSSTTPFIEKKSPAPYIPNVNIILSSGSSVKGNSFGR